jgi:hypothetical protein
MRFYLRGGVGGELLILLSIGYIEKGCVYISMQKLLSKSIQRFKLNIVINTTKRISEQLRLGKLESATGSGVRTPSGANMYVKVMPTTKKSSKYDLRRLETQKLKEAGPIPLEAMQAIY